MKNLNRIWIGVFLPGVVYLFVLISNANAEGDDWYSRWLDRVTETQSEQPHWMTPLNTVTARLEQEFRTDLLSEPTPKGKTLYNLDNSKGLELIPFSPVEVIFNLPPYMIHNTTGVEDGFGDLSFLVKYRILSANEKEGDYILSVFLGLSLPTATAENGSPTSVFTPTIAGGKGFGPFDIQTTFGASLPVNDSEFPGHALAWNSTLQYHYPDFYIWPEIENNYTHYAGGAKNGKSQNFITTGVVFGRFTIHERTAISTGVGFQIATTHYNAYNHGGIFSLRIPF